MVPGGGALSLTYTTSCCRPLLHLDPVAKFVWKSSLLVLLDSQGALCGLLLYFECCFPFRNEQHYGNLFFPHGMLGRKLGLYPSLGWASSRLNRSAQVWKPTGKEVRVFI